MRRHACAVVLLLDALISAPARAQDAAPRLPLVAVDLHLSVPGFPQEPTLADSRGLVVDELPGHGLGSDVTLTVYPVRWRAVTFGLGGSLMTAHASFSPSSSATTTDTAALVPVAERLRTIGSQLSFNFGTGNGWSYLSAGIGKSTWSIVPDGAMEAAADQQSLKTLNYGGGARWFLTKHVAFSFDVRFYAINPGLPQGELPGSPRTTLRVIGAGISLK
jgi:hypothetical protein